MAQASYAVPSFLGGEISAAAQGRFDKPDYRISLRTCLNGFPIEIGAWTRRPGTRFAAATRDGGVAHLVKFDFNQASPYFMEFSSGALRFFSGTTLVKTNDARTVIAVSTASPGVFQTDSAHGWATGDAVTFGNYGFLVPLLQNRQFLIVVTAADKFTLQDPLNQQAAIDGATLGAIPAGMTVSRVLEIATPWTANYLADLRSVQAVTATAVQSILLEGNFKPQVLTVTAAPTASTFATFALAAAAFVDGPYLDPVSSTLDPSLGNNAILPSGGLSGTIALTALSTLNINGGAGFAATDVGRHIRLLSEPPAWAVGTSYLKGNFVNYAGVYWEAVVNSTGTTGQPPGTDITTWTITGGLSIATWTWGIINGFISTTEVTALIKGPPLIYEQYMFTWRLAAYSDTTGWPTCGTYHEGRLWLANKIGNRFDSTMSNKLDTFSPTAPDGTVTDNNGISYVLNATDINPIFWMQPDLQGIIMGTQGGEWLAFAPTTGPMTPTNISARRMTKIGCANIEPRRTEHTNVFVKRYGRKLMEYFADVYSGKFSAPNLADKTSRTRKGIAEIAYTEAVTPIIWGRCTDGSWFGVTYKRDTLTTSQGPAYAAWHGHALGSGRTVESICAGPSVGGDLDTLALITSDGHQRHVELLTDTPDELSSLASAWYLDDAVNPTSFVPSATGATLNGLWHLNGKTVQVYVGGLDCGDRSDDKSHGTPFTDFLVTNGSCFVPYGDGVSAGPGRGLFTSLYTAGMTLDKIVVGFTYNSDAHVVRPMMPADSGARNGPAFAKLSRGHRYGMKVVNTLGLWVGGDLAGTLHPAPFTMPDGVTLLKPSGFYATAVAYSGIVQDTLRDDYGYEGGSPAWRVSRPWPATIVIVGSNLSTQDQ